MSFKHLFVLFVAATSVFTVALAQRPPDPPKGVARLFPGMGQFPNLLDRDVVVRFKPVQLELKMTEDQIKQYETIIQKRMEKFQQMFEEQRRSKKSMQAKESLEARDAILKESQTATEQNLTPGQRDRLTQIQLQVRNAMAFERPEIQKQLDLTQSQIEQIKKIAEKSRNEILQASEVPADVKPADGGDSPTMDDVRAFVKTPQFVESHRKSVERIRLARIAMMDRVAAVLNDRQNAEYRKMLGPPFEVEGLAGPGDDQETLTMKSRRPWASWVSAPIPSST